MHWSAAQSDTPRRYRDRRDGGQRLGRAVAEHGFDDPVVLGLARGGVPVAAEVARVLDAPLDVVVARKVGAPGQPELALGAVTSEGSPLYDERLLTAFGLDSEDVANAGRREQEEARRRVEKYRRGEPVAREGRDVVLVDDGFATGATARAAARMVRESGPRTVVLAAPCGAPDAVSALEREADAVVCPMVPPGFSAVGEWYADFGQTDDDEILRILDEMRGAGDTAD